MVEPGLDLHEWETRWAELQDAAADAPDETLPEMVRFIGEVLRERGLEPHDPITEETEDPELVRDYQAGLEISRALEVGRQVEPEDVLTAIEDLTEIYEYVSEDRAAP